MRPDLVVDIGNSRIKWGRVRSGVKEMVSLAGHDPEAWTVQLREWDLRCHLTWAVAGVQPQWQAHFTRWAEARGDIVQAITREHIPIPIEVDEPETVGIDRLLNALITSRLKPASFQAIVISVGTAVTVDLVRENGAFAGGTIFPGPRLMADSLHRFTAKLPLVSMDGPVSQSPPCTNTRDAIRIGISSAIAGGAALIAETMSANREASTWVILTGGAIESLSNFPVGRFAQVVYSPTLTLEGIRIAAESLP